VEGLTAWKRRSTGLLARLLEGLQNQLLEETSQTHLWEGSNGSIPGKRRTRIGCSYCTCSNCTGSPSPENTVTGAVLASWSHKIVAPSGSTPDRKPQGHDARRAGRMRPVGGGSSKLRRSWPASARTRRGRSAVIARGRLARKVQVDGRRCSSFLEVCFPGGVAMAGSGDRITGCVARHGHCPTNDRPSRAAPMA